MHNCHVNPLSSAHGWSVTATSYPSDSDQDPELSCSAERTRPGPNEPLLSEMGCPSVGGISQQLLQIALKLRHLSCAGSPMPPVPTTISPVSKRKLGGRSPESQAPRMGGLCAGLKAVSQATTFISGLWPSVAVFILDFST